MKLANHRRHKGNYKIMQSAGHALKSPDTVEPEEEPESLLHTTRHLLKLLYDSTIIKIKALMFIALRAFISILLVTTRREIVHF